jgi:hypothetical protein
VARLGAVETAPAAGCAGFGDSVALTLGRSGSEAGASSGGGSWAMAKLVPQSTTKNDRPRTARNIGFVSRNKGRPTYTGALTLVSSVRAGSKNPFF